MPGPSPQKVQCFPPFAQVSRAGTAPPRRNPEIPRIGADTPAPPCLGADTGRNKVWPPLRRGLPTDSRGPNLSQPVYVISGTWTTCTRADFLIRALLDRVFRGLLVFHPTTSQDCHINQTMDIDKQSRAYKAWYNAQRRCDDTTGSCYHLYGGRGITFAPEWRDFAVFHAELGDCPDGLSLERVNNMKGYQPGNCIWATPQAQQLNKRTNVHYTFDGMTQTLSQWAKQLGMNPGTVSKRLKRGWFIWRGQLREG